LKSNGTELLDAAPERCSELFIVVPERTVRQLEAEIYRELLKYRVLLILSVFLNICLILIAIH
jgi:hypothetical protein